MTRLYEPTAEDIAVYRAWVESRPEAIRAVAAKLDTWSLYRLKTTGQIVALHSISEPAPPEHPGVTVTVTVLREYNPIPIPMPDFGVFGVDPDDLELYEAQTNSAAAAVADHPKRGILANNESYAYQEGASSRNLGWAIDDGGYGGPLRPDPTGRRAELQAEFERGWRDEDEALKNEREGQGQGQARATVPE